MKPYLKHSKSTIDKAGSILAGKYKSSKDNAIEILENFRSIHIHPMKVFRMSLARKSKPISSDVLISQRLKRAPSIINKLKIQKDMSLTQMQDIAGLRVVFDNLNQVYKLRDAIRLGEKQTAFKSTHLKERDYIIDPKESGYRSLHLVYKYDKKVPPTQQCRIEIQLRTKIQHAWATAVEVIGTYLRQPLKQSFGDEKLLELFKDISIVFARLEAKTVDLKLFKKTAGKISSLNLRQMLSGFSVVTQESGRQKTGKYILISLDFKNKSLQLRRYSESKLEEANNEYSELEKKYLNDPNMEVVLVSVDDIRNLEKLYPNYFLDTREFVRLLDKVDEIIKND